MRTILMICPFAKPNIGGVEAHLEKLANCISKRKYKEILVTYQPLTTRAKGARYEKGENIEIYRTAWFGNGWFQKLEPYFPLVFIYLFPGLFLKSLLLYIKRHKEVDVIHAHGFVAAAITKILVKIIKKSCVVSTHAIYKLQRRRILKTLIRWLLKDFDTILAVGEPSKKELIAIGFEEEKIMVHPNWVDTDVFKPLDRDQCRKAFNLRPNDFVVLFLGRFIEIKGLLILLEVAKRIKRDMKFVFVGDGPLAGVVQNAAKTSDRIVYCGKLSDDGIIKAYNAADVFVSPVLYEEGFASVYLESLACGTPVISARRGCLPYFLSPEVADLLPAVNAETVFEVLENNFEAKDTVNGKRSLCREYAEENFGEKNAEVILNSYL